MTASLQQVERRAPRGTDTLMLPRLRPRSDRAICLGLRAGDPWAARLLYERVVNVVGSTLRKLLGGDDEREDLEQQALERIVKSIVSGRYRHICSLSTWARQIAQHVGLDSIRARSRYRRYFDASTGTEAIEGIEQRQRSTEHIVDANRSVRSLRKALASIPEHSAETLILYDMLGHTLSEVASMTGVSVAAAQSRLVRTRRKLLRAIAETDGHSGF